MVVTLFGCDIDRCVSRGELHINISSSNKLFIVLDSLLLNIDIYNASVLSSGLCGPVQPLVPPAGGGLQRLPVPVAHHLLRLLARGHRPGAIKLLSV